MNSIIQDMKHNYFVNAVIMVILGLILVIWPDILGNILCYILGGALILMGIFQVIGFIRGEHLGFYNKFSVLMGIVLVLLHCCCSGLIFSGCRRYHHTVRWCDGCSIYSGHQEGRKYKVVDCSDCSYHNAGTGHYADCESICGISIDHDHYRCCHDL